MEKLSHKFKCENKKYESEAVKQLIRVVVIYPPMYRNAFSSSYVMGAMLFTGHLVFKGIDAFRSPSKTSIVKCW